MTTHGMSKSDTYRSWHTMRRRCYDKGFKDFPYYGGRGIKVCERWMHFENFLSDMGERPPGMTLDRKDVNGDYTPENCAWATHRQQMNNTRRNNKFTYAGNTMTLAEWARHFGIPRARLSARIHQLKWSIDRALEYDGLRPWKK